MAAAPTTPNHPARLNRAMLTVIGLILLLAGAYGLLRGLGVLGPDAVGPIGLPAQDPAAALVPAGATVPGWASYVAIAVAAIVGLLCLRWLLAQTRRQATAQTWRLTDHAGLGTTELDTRDAASAFGAEIETYSGVHQAAAVTTGDRAHPELHLTLSVEDGASVNDLRDRIDTTALPRLRQALELDALPAEVLVRLGEKRTTGRAR